MGIVRGVYDLSKKIKAVLFIVILLALATCFDMVRAKMFHIEVVSVEPFPVIADGKTPAQIEVLLTGADSAPVAGHSLFIYSLNGGAFKANRIITDENGTASFLYYPYKAGNLNTLHDVVIRVIDESNSVFIEVNSETEFTLELAEPQKEETGIVNFDSVYGE